MFDINLQVGHTVFVEENEHEDETALPSAARLADKHPVASHHHFAGLGKLARPAEEDHVQHPTLDRGTMRV